MISGRLGICFASCYCEPWLGAQAEVPLRPASIGVGRPDVVAGLSGPHGADRRQLRVRAGAAGQSRRMALRRPPGRLALVYLAAMLYLPRSPAGCCCCRWCSVAGRIADRQPRAVRPRPDILLLGPDARALAAGGHRDHVRRLPGRRDVPRCRAYALKHGQSPAGPWRLPSLEWLERVNSRMLAVSTVFILLGFASGVVLSS